MPEPYKVHLSEGVRFLHALKKAEADASWEGITVDIMPPVKLHNPQAKKNRLDGV